MSRRFLPPTSAAAKAQALGIKLALDNPKLDCEQWSALWLLWEELENYAQFLAHMESQRPVSA